MLKMTKIALMGAIAAAAMVSTGANAATVSASAEVDILSPVQLQQMAGLDFGVIGGAVGGTVTIPIGTDTRTCSVGLACASTSQRGRFEVTAANTYNVTIVVDAAATLNNGGNSMSVALTPSVTSLVASGSAQTFYVGGTLTVGAGQAAGTYNGNYNVTADYQ